MTVGRKSRQRTEAETALIGSVTHDGKGIAAVAGKKVFVPGALLGETVIFKRRKRRRNYDEAQLLEVVESSPERVPARCAAFGNCGGCSLQHISAEAQRDLKQRALKDSLQRIGKVLPERWLDPVYVTGSESSWNYRRRARLAVKDVPAKGRVLVGFREAHAPYVCDMHRCEVLAAPVDDMIDALSELVGRLSIRARLPQIEVAVADNSTALVMRVLDPPTDEDLAILVKFARANDVRIALQTGGPNTIESLNASDASNPLVYSLPEFDVEIEFEATDFVQVNPKVNRLLVANAIDFLEVTTSHRVLDLYCGIGNFSLPLARKAQHVLAIEGESAQVERGRANALRNEISNCEFLQADLSNIDGSEAWLQQAWDRVLIDPARSGAEKLIENMSRIGASRIVYVSCHAATLARDSGRLVEQQNYRFEAAGIVDMFPHTGHVESIAVFRKNS